MKHFLFSLLFVLISTAVFGQLKTIEQKPGQASDIQLKPLFSPNQHELDDEQKIPLQIVPMGQDLLLNAATRIQVTHRNADGNPIFFKGSLQEQKGLTFTEQTALYLAEISRYFEVENVNEEYTISSSRADEIGMYHISIQQTYQGVPVDAGELKLHAKNGIINVANGSFVSTPKLENTVPTLSIDEIEALTIADFEKKGIYKRIEDSQRNLVPEQTFSAELYIINRNKVDFLVYKVDAYANVIQRFVYFVDAHSGAIIDSYKNYCSFHGEAHGAHNHGAILPPDGPATANAQDLSNTNRTINTYEFSNEFYLVDASRTMFQAGASNMPNEPVGAIWTIDAFNTNPQNNNFEYDHVKSANNSWSSKTAVSAHYNGGVAYEYFKDVHNRNSINGEGGNIVSLINISDPDNGGGFDNAFWNGAAMFYGNGNTAFDPLAGSLDVAGHEMSHGVVQATANLTYQGESGALNESFADVFGVMMDREDWLLGEDVVKTSTFPSGALRDMSDPHNGGNSLGDPGYQPDNTSEQFTGSQDNGGVHINSGIVNHAFYLFATNSAVGLEKAERIYYRALTEYLSASSQFIDCRASVEQAAEDLYGAAEKDAASSAFQSVGIGGGGNTTDYETEVGMNTGDDFLLVADAQLSNLVLFNNSLQVVSFGDPLSQVDLRSKPSVTDNGSDIYFVGSDNNIYNISIDWDANSANVQLFDDQGVWRSVAISKDGTKIAALTDQTNNNIIVLNLATAQQNTFELYNPTYTEGVSTGDVDFADAMEFDFTGEWIMYDQQSTISGASGNISYWDIGFLNVFRPDGSFESGGVQKLFSQLPNGTSVGNPTFSKNSPHIIAFDQLTSSSYKVMGANIESNNIQEIIELTGLGYPSFNNADSQIVYEFPSFFGTDIGLSELQEDKITPVFNSESLILEGGLRPVILNNGERVLINTKNFDSDLEFDIHPNPVRDLLRIDLGNNFEAELLRIYDNRGVMIYEAKITNTETTINTSTWTSGLYFVQMSADDRSYVKRIVKK